MMAVNSDIHSTRLTIWGGIFAGVVRQIEQNLFNRAGIGLDGHGCLRFWEIQVDIEAALDGATL